jgi:hypothetical protein
MVMIDERMIESIVRIAPTAPAIIGTRVNQKIPHLKQNSLSFKKVFYALLSQQISSEYDEGLSLL